MITLPGATVKGLLSGRMYPELGGVYHISASSGFISEIRFSGQGFISGERNSFEAMIYRRDDELKLAIYSASGRWNESFLIRDCKKNEIIETYDTNSEANTPAKLQIPDLEDQDAWESRRAWQGVISALNLGKVGDTIDEKTKLEKSQRAMRIAEAKSGKVWQPLAFGLRNSEYQVFSKLASATGWRLQEDKTNGVWEVDTEKVKNLRGGIPFRGDLTPFG